MAILSGYKKVKDREYTGSGFKLLSRWTHASTVEFDDGKTLVDRLGALSVKPVTESEYNALGSKADSNTIYIVTE